MPVGAAVYQALADLNRACEQAAAGVDTLLRFGFFREAQLEILKFRIAGASAEINRECMETLDSREDNNAIYFDRRVEAWEKQFQDPADVLLKAEEYKRELRKKRRKKWWRPSFRLAGFWQHHPFLQVAERDRRICFQLNLRASAQVGRDLVFPSEVVRSFSAPHQVQLTPDEEERRNEAEGT